MHNTRCDMSLIYQNWWKSTIGFARNKYSSSQKTRISPSWYHWNFLTLQFIFTQLTFTQRWGFARGNREACRRPRPLGKTFPGCIWEDDTEWIWSGRPINQINRENRPELYDHIDQLSKSNQSIEWIDQEELQDAPVNSWFGHHTLLGRFRKMAQMVVKTKLI